MPRGLLICVYLSMYKIKLIIVINENIGVREDFKIRIFNNFYLMFILLFLLRERVRVRTHERGRGREGILSRIRAVSAEPDLGLPLRSRETTPEPKSRVGCSTE